MILYGYWRSSASYRVRMALNLKAIPHSHRSIHLVRDGGEQYGSDYRDLNPQAQVPTLVHGAVVVTQSMAILEYLEEVFPTRPLLPEDPCGRARVRSLCNVIACDTHPINNLRVLKYLTETLQVPDSARSDWYRHWVSAGLDAFERMLAASPDTGRFCHGDQPTLADCCLLPQIYNSRRFDCDESNWPEIRRVCESLQAIAVVKDAAPENQIDAE